MSPPAQAMNSAAGCVIAGLVLAVLIALGVWALAAFEKGLDGYGQLEQAGASGSGADPLGPGATARYEDGLEGTVSLPRPEADGTYSLTVTYENGTDEELRPGGESFDRGVSGIGSAPLVVRPGKSLDDHVTDYGLTWLDREKSASVLMPPLGEDEKRIVPVRIKPTRKGTSIPGPK
ncbi:hypothetical protein ABT126_39730 [Streptomyces sp. NPDC002012]|uniref:hypothetical protein n=1 Tax=unclassified Streptomyces TaxID=2593676 RepID=UPI0033284B1F